MKFLKESLYLTKPIKGVNNSRLVLSDEASEINLLSKFTSICEKDKEDIGLMKQNDTTYEFLHQNEENMISYAVNLAKQLNLPLVIL